MKDKVYKRAVIFMCVLIAASVIYGGMRSVGTYRNTVISEYYGDDGAHKAADSIFASASNLLSVAERYIKDEAETIELRKGLEKSQSSSINAEYSAVLSVAEQSFALYKRLGEYELTEADRTYRTELFYNIKSYYSVLCKQEYNSSALKYNATVNRFPARLFALISMKSSLPVFSADDVILED